MDLLIVFWRHLLDLGCKIHSGVTSKAYLVSERWKRKR